MTTTMVDSQQQSIDEPDPAEVWCRDHTGQPFSFEAFGALARSFHGYPAPGLLIGGRMVDLARRGLPDGILFDAISETSKCLPDAVQILTLCSTGNGWLKTLDLGRFAVILYDKYTGDGRRVHLDAAALDDWPEIKNWFFALKPKPEQNTPRLMAEIRAAGDAILEVKPVRVRPELLEKPHMAPYAVCPDCGEAYPRRHGPRCRACSGASPVITSDPAPSADADGPPLTVVPIESAPGRRALHDMTRIIPGREKGPAFHSGQEIAGGDLCRLQQMGRRHLYVEGDTPVGPEWVHENDAALAFARAMAGEGITFKAPPREGKVTFKAARSGLFTVAVDRLTGFNLTPEVMCASRRSFSVVEKGDALAGTRAIPLYIHRGHFEAALEALSDGPVFAVRPMRSAKVGILVTGTEVFRGLIQDRFAPVIQSKVERLGCRVVGSRIVPDDRREIADSLKALMADGADLLVTTAGLSVDPDDVTRKGILDAGVTDIVYGAPILPGAMTLVARIGSVQVMGVPACGLYFDHTSFDLLLPRLLAGLTITRHDLARMGHGAFCLECGDCRFPNCPFGNS